MELEKYNVFFCFVTSYRKIISFVEVRETPAFFNYFPITCFIVLYTLLEITGIITLLVLTTAIFLNRQTNTVITPYTQRSVCERLSHYWWVNPVFWQSLSSKEASPGLPTSISYCSALIKVTLDLPLTWTACYGRVVGTVEDSAFLISQEQWELSRCEMQQS